MAALDHRLLTQFVTVARSGGFRPAAEALNMSQPPLSRAIATLEGKLRVELFVRSAKGVTLTAAGAALFEDAVDALARLDRAERRVKRIAGRAEALRIGFVSAALSAAAPALLRRLERDGAPKPVLREMTTPEQCAALAEGALDVGFLHPPVDIPPGLALRALGFDEFLVMLPKDHRLREASDVRTADLIGETFVLFSKDQGPTLFQRLEDVLASEGELDVAATASRIQTQLSLVGAGLGVGFIARSIALKLSHSDVVFRPWRDRPAEIGLRLSMMGPAELIDDLLGPTAPP